MNVRPTLLLAALMSFALPIEADPPPDLSARRIKPEQDYPAAALDAYGSGYAFIERATRYEHDAEAARTDHERTEALRGASQAYQDALQSFDEAVRADERMYEAHTYIGYVHRKQGRYLESMTAYATALRLKPNYAQAIEYQGEAFLGLDRFEDARFNYLRLYALDQQQAARLLTSMRAWLKERERDPGIVSQDQLRQASAWIRSQRIDEHVSVEAKASGW